MGGKDNQRHNVAKKATISKSSAPQSVFAKGAYKSPIAKGRKDSRHLLFVEGMQEGIVVLYLKKANRDEEPYLRYDMDLLYNSPDKLEELGINCIVHRRGCNGDTAKPQGPASEYYWRQFLCIIGEEANTVDGRREQANTLIEYLNRNAVTPNYQFPKKVRFGGDNTSEPMGRVDGVLRDADVLGVMVAAYPSTSVVEMATYDDIMDKFWNDIEYGKEVLRQFSEAE